ncbi:MAG TPA: glycosyltransferase, partial [Chloroflexota bacterium]|nr:glycosyltransferase [Chloroflexota bacterium]
EWNEPALVGRIGDWVAAQRTVGDAPLLFFHDTHHRVVSEPEAMAAYDLRAYDGVLAFGRVVHDRYLAAGWTTRAWVWHEAADTRVFHPLAVDEGAPLPTGDLVWIGNWGDGERGAELREFLLEPVRSLGLQANVYGVRYPRDALDTLREAGLTYRGWLPNHEAPRVFARHRLTIHVPRRPYAAALPGIPTIRVFEALACGIPLICAPWQDSEELFTPGEDYLVAHDGAEMRRQLHAVLTDPDLAQSLREHGLRTVRERHTCAHRVDELLTIVAGLRGAA